MLNELLPIRGYSHYKVDRYGNVYSYKRNSHGQLLKPLGGAHRQAVIYMYDDNGVRYRKAISRLVAETFLPNPHNLPNVVHKDSNRKNNVVTNLQWADSKATHTIAMQNNVYPQYKVSGRTKEIKQLRASGMQINAIAKKFNVNRITVRWHLLGGTYSAKNPKQ